MTAYWHPTVSQVWRTQ